MTNLFPAQARPKPCSFPLTASQTWPCSSSEQLGFLKSCGKPQTFWRLFLALNYFGSSSSSCLIRRTSSTCPFFLLTALYKRQLLGSIRDSFPWQPGCMSFQESACRRRIMTFFLGTMVPSTFGEVGVQPNLSMNLFTMVPTVVLHFNSRNLVIAPPPLYQEPRSSPYQVQQELAPYGCGFPSYRTAPCSVILHTTRTRNNIRLSLVREYNIVILHQLVENTSLAAQGHSLTACNAALPATPHRPLNPKWPTGSGNR